MALGPKQQRFCKVTHTENGRTWNRRIHTMMVQAPDGKVHHLAGDQLPDSIALYSGVPYHGAHLAEVLLNPKGARGRPLLPVHEGWISKRDAMFLVLGMVAFRLIVVLADTAAMAMH